LANRVTAEQVSLDNVKIAATAQIQCRDALILQMQNANATERGTFTSELENEQQRLNVTLSEEYDARLSIGTMNQEICSLRRSNEEAARREENLAELSQRREASMLDAVRGLELQQQRQLESIEERLKLQAEAALVSQREKHAEEMAGLRKRLEESERAAPTVVHAVPNPIENDIFSSPQDGNVTPRPTPGVGADAPVVVQSPILGDAAAVPGAASVPQESAALESISEQLRYMSARLEEIDRRTDLQHETRYVTFNTRTSPNTIAEARDTIKPDEWRRDGVPRRSRWGQRASPHVDEGSEARNLSADFHRAENRDMLACAAPGGNDEDHPYRNSRSYLASTVTVPASVGVARARLATPLGRTRKPRVQHYDDPGRAVWDESWSESDWGWGGSGGGGWEWGGGWDGGDDPPGDDDYYDEWYEGEEGGESEDDWEAYDPIIDLDDTESSSTPGFPRRGPPGGGGGGGPPDGGSGPPGGGTGDIDKIVKAIADIATPKSNGKEAAEIAFN